MLTNLPEQKNEQAARAPAVPDREKDTEQVRVSQELAKRRQDELTNALQEEREKRLQAMEQLAAMRSRLERVERDRKQTEAALAAAKQRQIEEANTDSAPRSVGRRYYSNVTRNGGEPVERE